MQGEPRVDGRQHADAIRDLKKRWGPELILLAHHYQRPEVAALGDRLGDSYELARDARDAREARFIVFCGVRFMAEAAEVLRRDEQVVLHPEPSAGCPLADFASVEQATEAWRGLSEILGDESALMPLVYMNSSAGMKAFTGARGGAVCTSSNAPRAFEWGLRQRRAVLFMPDEHLGRNTCRKLGLAPREIVLYDPYTPGGGLEPERIRAARAVLWKGYCHVHTAFTVEDVAWAREKHPEGRILVHPECPEPVVACVDGSGSTSYLVREVAAAAPGSTLIIGTEVSLVDRLAAEHADRKVLPLRRSLCFNMSRITLAHVRAVCEALPGGEPLCLPEEVKRDAFKALERMLAI
ncbi:MAG: quinolinate synthase NadA [Deltaproteobacteria bacterium]|nr:quinolinate synthase NadA [Deltaproteobacteria bacterium]